MNRLWNVGWVVLSLVFASSADAAVTLSLGKGEPAVTINIDGREFAKYLIGTDQPKPYLWPVRGSDGTVLTRKILQKGEGDHHHHKGVWVAVDEVGGIKFWAEDGKITNRSVELLSAEGNPARFQVVNDWQDKAGKTVVTETTVISVFSNRLVAYDITFTTESEEPVEFGDTKEGLFGFRMVDSMREKEGGQVFNAEGAKGTKDCWGKPSDWVDYVGTVEGKKFGVAIFDHPLNLRPSRYHVRDYGLFSINPFGEKSYTGGKQSAEPFYLQADGKLRLRYALYVHDGDTESGNVATVYRDYLKSGS